MRKIFRLMAAAAVAVAGLASCTKEEVPAEEFLEVNANNIAGEWELAEVNGKPLDENTWFLIEFVRKDSKFTITTNMDSFVGGSHELTGEFSITKDPVKGSIIRGHYDHSTDEWKSRYIVRDLTHDSMVWIAVNNPDNVQVFKRVVEE